MPQQHFHVDTEQLSAHGHEVQRIQSSAGQAADAAQQVTPGGWDNAYGVICQQFPMMLRPIANQAIDALRRLTDAFGRAADKINTTAQAYEECERSHTGQIEDIGSRLGSQPPMPHVPSFGGHGGAGTASGPGGSGSRP